MSKVNLPLENACEPHEAARQPVTVDNQTLVSNNKERQNVTFAATTTDGISQQNNSLYKDLLSQPPTNLTHKQKLLWLQQRRTEGLWVQCDDCARWRYLPHVLDSHELPTKWYCWMNTDSSLASCSAPEDLICLHDEEDLIHAEYAAGSLVAARMAGFPWWPAMVVDCPDTEQYYWLDGFSDIPTHYNVAFFDANDVSRAWIAPDHLIPYKDSKKILSKSLTSGKYRKRLDAAITQANDAEKLTLSARLAKYSFVARYNGNILSPRKIKKKQLQRYQNNLKRKLNIDFTEGFSNLEDEENNQTEKKKSKKKNLCKKTVTKDTSKYKKSDKVLTDTTNESVLTNTTKEFSSLVVQLDSGSGLIQNNISEVPRNGAAKEKDLSIIDKLNETEPTEETRGSEKSDDFDF